MLLKFINDLQILKGIQQEKKKPTTQSSIPYWNSSMIDDEEARDNFLKDVYTFLKKFSRIPFGVTPKCGTISDGFQNFNCPSWNRPLFYFDDDEDDYIPLGDIIARYSTSKAIIPDLPIEEPDNLLNMGDEHLDTISSIEIRVPIPSEFEGISDDTCDVPVRDDSSTFDALNDNSEILSNSNDDDTSSDDDDFEDVEYVSLEEVNDEKEFDLEDIFSNTKVILREKLLKSIVLFYIIESLKDKPTPDRVLESPSLFPIPSRIDYPDFEDSRAHGFVHSYIRASYPQLHLGNPIS
ncbi:hypothetical protein Tco_1404004 [Tanacetum coccineum]